MPEGFLVWEVIQRIMEVLELDVLEKVINEKISCEILLVTNYVIWITDFKTKRVHETSLLSTIVIIIYILHWSRRRLTLTIRLIGICCTQKDINLVDLTVLYFCGEMIEDWHEMVLLPEAKCSVCCCDITSLGMHAINIGFSYSFALILI